MPPPTDRRKPSLRLSSFFYIARWLPDYTRRDLRGDLIAGMTVGAMLVPQSMAYAVLAGVPPIYGLYASLVPLLVYPIFGTSRHLAVGVIAIDMLIVAAGLGVVAEAGTPRYIGLAVLLATMVGVIQVALGLARFGFLVNLLSRPVIAGFTSAAALIIVFSQVGNLLGIAVPQSQHIYTLLWGAARRIDGVHGLSLLLGLTGILLILVLRNWKPGFPGAIAAVVLGTLAAWSLDFAGHGVAVVGTVPEGLPAFDWPETDTATLRALLPTAVTLALVQFMTVISLGKVFAARHRYTIHANRELIGIGMANLAGSLFRSIPISGSFSRTAVNGQAGARTALANVVAALLVVLTLLFLTPLFAFLPIPILGAIIVVSVVGLFDWRELRFLLRAKRVDGGIALLTFLITLLVGIQEGIIVGIIASVVAIMYRISRPNVALLGHLPGTRSFRDLRHHAEAEALDGILMLRVDASFSFANAEFLRDFILNRTLSAAPPLRAVIIDASSINDLDTTAVTVLASITETLRDRGIDLCFGGVKEPVLSVMKRSGLYEKLGPDHFYLSPHRAVRDLLERWGVSAEYLETVPGAHEEDEA